MAPPEQLPLCYFITGFYARSVREPVTGHPEARLSPLFWRNTAAWRDGV